MSYQTLVEQNIKDSGSKQNENFRLVMFSQRMHNEKQRREQRIYK